MNVTRARLQQAAAENIISAAQADALYHYLQSQDPVTAKFSFTHVLYYFGGLVAIGAMTVFMNLGWETFGGGGIVVISLLYALAGLAMCHRFANKSLVVPAGICATFVICLMPLAIYGLQEWLGVWPDNNVYREYHRVIQWHWLYMELGTLLVGVALVWRYRYPFMLMPIAVTLWYMTMDIAAMISGGDLNWTLRWLVSLYGGLLMIAVAIWVDIRSRHTQDFAFWIYLLGVVAFWIGLTSQQADSEFSRFVYFMINLLMIGIGVLLVRRVFVIFGALGSCGYIGYLASDIFQDSWFFPLSLTIIGLGIIYLGVLWQKHESMITQRARSVLPTSLRELLDGKD